MDHLLKHSCTNIPGREFAAVSRVPLLLVPQDVATFPDENRGEIDVCRGELIKVGMGRDFVLGRP